MRYCFLSTACVILQICAIIFKHIVVVFVIVVASVVAAVIVVYHTNFPLFALCLLPMPVSGHNFILL